MAAAWLHDVILIAPPVLGIGWSYFKLLEFQKDAKTAIRKLEKITSRNKIFILCLVQHLEDKEVVSVPEILSELDDKIREYELTDNMPLLG